MQQGLLHLHNFLRWFVLLFGIIVILRSISGMGGNKAFSATDKRMALFLLISADIQLLLGISLYISKGWFDVLKSGADIMSNPVNRFFAVEHLAGMLIAIVLIHIGYSSAKKNIADQAKFKKLFWFTLIAFIIIIVTIPWPFRELVGRPLFPGMH
jgi:hypothetical protein